MGSQACENALRRLFRPWLQTVEYNYRSAEQHSTGNPWRHGISELKGDLVFITEFCICCILYDRTLYQVKQGAGDQGITAENTEKLKHTDFSSMKTRLMKALVWPVAMYGCESWTLRKKKHVLTPLRWKVWERFCGFYGQQKTNEWALNKAGVKRELLDTVKATKLAYYGHTMRKLDRLRVSGDTLQYRLEGVHFPRAYWTGDTTVYLFTEATSHSCHTHVSLFTFASRFSKTSMVTVNDCGMFW